MEDAGRGREAGEGRPAVVVASSPDEAEDEHSFRPARLTAPARPPPRMTRAERRDAFLSTRRGTRTATNISKDSDYDSDSHRKSISELLRGTGDDFFAAKLLLFGCITGLIGFVLVCSVIIVCNVSSNVYIAECLDYQPLPSTVSEIVQRWERASARIFFAFVLLSGLSIFFSKYGFIFRNCASDHYVQVPTCYGLFNCINRFLHELDLRWCDVRMFVPPVGMLLVALLPSVPPSDYNVPNLIMHACHGTAAMMMFLGVFLCELQFFRTHVQTEYHLYGGALQEFMTSFWRDRVRTPRQSMSNPDRIQYHMPLGELIVRMIFNCGNISFFVLFIIFQVIIFHNRCSLDVSFLIMPVDGSGSSCVDRSCKEVRQYSACNDANLQYQVELQHRLESEKDLHNEVRDVPVAHPPLDFEDVKAERWGGLSSTLQTMLQNHGSQGCFFHFDAHAVSTPDKYMGVFQFNTPRFRNNEELSPRPVHQNPDDFSTWRICSCGMEKGSGGAEPAPKSAALQQERNPEDVPTPIWSALAPSDNLSLSTGPERGRRTKVRATGSMADVWNGDLRRSRSNVSLASSTASGSYAELCEEDGQHAELPENPPSEAPAASSPPLRARGAPWVGPPTLLLPAVSLDPFKQRGKESVVKTRVKAIVPTLTTWEGGWSPSCRYYAFGSFLAEVMAGVCCIVLHLVIWYYAEERLSTEDRANTLGHAEKWRARNHRMERRLMRLEDEMFALLDESDEDDAPVAQQ